MYISKIEEDVKKLITAIQCLSSNKYDFCNNNYILLILSQMLRFQYYSSRYESRNKVITFSSTPGTQNIE